MNKRLFSSLLFSLFFICTFAQAPTGLSGMGFRTTVHLQWDNYTGFEPIGFNIYRSTVSENYSTPARRVGAYSDYTDYNLDPSTIYFYKISAFDGAGNESLLSDEITVSTNSNNYRKVANLDLLIPIYTGGMTATSPDEIKQSLEFARRVFFRNSFGQVNLKFHYWIIDGYPPLNTDGVANFNTIGADLTARGILNNQYDAIHIMALKLYGWYGGATWLGQTAGSMGFDWRSFDPNNHYGQGNAWLFTHEFGHSLDRLADMSGFPEMIFNHYPWAHPIPAELGGVFDAGENFDGMSMVLRLFDHHLDFKTPHDGYLEVVDNDNDGLADNDPRLANDEQRFGSNPNSMDTDNDGLNDLDEFTANNYSGSNPNNSDTDSDGINDGEDVYPTSNFDRTNEKVIGNISINGFISANEDWHEMASGTYYSKLPGATLNTYTTWDDDYLYFAFESNQRLKYYLKIDGSGENGIFASDVKWPGGNYDDINDQAWGNAWYDEATLIILTSDTEVYKRGQPITGSKVNTVVHQNGIYTTEVKLPHNLGPGFSHSYVYPDAPEITEQVFGLGDIIGIQLTAQPLSTSNGYEWDDYRNSQWLSLGEPFHYYDMELVGGGSPGNYCTSVSDFPWEDWITKVTFGAINSTSGKSTYTDFTTKSTDMAKGITANISLTTGFSYYTWDEYWKVWIDYNQNGIFEEPSEIAFQGIKNKPPNGTSTSTLNGTVDIPTTATLGQTRMRVTMKRGAYATPCETIPFGEIEDYTINIIPGVGGEADLELTASANPATIGSGTVHYTVNLKNNGPAAANNVAIKHTKSGNFFSYSTPTVTTGSFNQLTDIWTLPVINAGETQTLEFDGLIVDMISQQVDFFEVIASSADDPDSTPDNDNGAKTPDEDDEAAVILSPATAPDLLLTNLVLPSPNVDPGGDLNFTYTVWNAGNWPAGLNGNIDYSFFVSTDNVYSSNDIPSGGGFILIDIPPGGSFPTAGAIIAPTNLPEGDYYLIIYLDPNNTILELNENNNIYSAPFHLNQTSGGTYCISKSNFPWEDWIAKVELSNLSNPSSKSPYSDFTSKVADVTAGQAYQLKLTTGYSYFTWDEYWRVWIDYNMDGDFMDNGEMAYSGILNAPSNSTPNATLTGTIFIPNTAPSGISTRMRVSMKRGAFPTPCEALAFGEVEDYTVHFSSAGLLPNLRIPYIEVIEANSNCFTNPGQAFGYIGGLVLNDGNTGAGAFNIKVTFSKDGQPGIDDVFWRDFQYGGLALNDVASINLNDPVPALLPPGKYFLLFQIDPEGQVTESDESDNLLVLTVQIGAPDFAFNIINGLPTSTMVGSTFNTMVGVQNLAPFPLLELANNLVVKVYLSEDSIYNSYQDTKIGMADIPYSQFSNGPLFGGGTATATIAAQIPSGTTLGDYFLFVGIADGCEQSFVNNRSRPIPIHIGGGTLGQYCVPKSNFPWEDWIAKVKLNTIDKASGKSKYSDFTSLSTALEKGVSYTVNLTTGYSWSTWDEYWSVWVDLNQDHIFQHPDELLFSKIMTRPSNGTATKTLNGKLTIPVNALTGPTRMRVVMKRGAFATPCENIPYGEIEDYTVNITDNIIGQNTDGRASNISLKAAKEMTWVNLYGFFILPENVVQIEVDKSTDTISFELIKTISGIKEKEHPHLITAKDEHPFDGDNYYRLLFILENGNEIYSKVEKVIFNALVDFTIFPNPASSEVFIYLHKVPDKEMTWTINDELGSPVWSQTIESGLESPYRIDISKLRPGMYYLTAIRAGRRPISKRLVVVR